MASIWMLSKDSMRGMRIASAVSDFIHEARTLNTPDEHTRERIIKILREIIEGARSFIEREIIVEAFLVELAENLVKELEIDPTGLIERLDDCIQHIENNETSGKCFDILRVIANNAINITSRSVDPRSLFLH